MNLPKVDDLVAQLKARVDDPAKQELVAHIAADAARVMAMALTEPEKAELEAQHLRAQALNLTAGEAAAVALAWQHWGYNLVFTLVQGALTRV